MKKKLALLLALVALAGFAAASALTVKQRQDTASLYAERYTVGELFVVERSSLSPVLENAEPVGVVGSPVEMTGGSPVARNKLVQDHWMYVVTVKEASAAHVTGGQYAIELQVDGTAIATLYVQQATNEPAVVEGVQARFGLGPVLQSSSLYYVVVKPYTPPGTTVSYAVRSGADGDGAAWIGHGGTVEGQVEPPITLAVGNMLALTARHGGDSAPHNIGITASGSTDPITPPGWSPTIDASGEEETISWTPGTAGTYTYQCQFHPTMAGTITVTA